MDFHQILAKMTKRLKRVERTVGKPQSQSQIYYFDKANEREQILFPTATSKYILFQPSLKTPKTVLFTEDIVPYRRGIHLTGHASFLIQYDFDFELKGNLVMRLKINDLYVGETEFEIGNRYFRSGFLDYSFEAVVNGLYTVSLEYEANLVVKKEDLSSERLGQILEEKTPITVIAKKNNSSLNVRVF